MTTDELITFATIVIAAFTVALFILQFRQHQHEKLVANANYKMSIFDKRIEIYFHIENFFREALRHGGPELEATINFKHDARIAKFLFPETVIDYVNELVEKGGEYFVAREEWEPLRERAFAGEKLSDQELAKKEKHMKDMHEIQRWFVAQIEENHLQQELGPYLKLPDSL